MLLGLDADYLDRHAVEKLFRVRERHARWYPRLWRPRRGGGKLYLIGMVEDVDSELLAHFVRHERIKMPLRSILTLNVKNPASIRSGGAVVNELTSCGFGHRLGICKGDEPNMPTSARQARLFRNGRNQAVRIPRDFELATDEVTIYREDHRLVIEPVERSPSLAEILSSLAPLDEHFASVDDPPAKPEEIF